MSGPKFWYVVEAEELQNGHRYWAHIGASDKKRLAMAVLLAAMGNAGLSVKGVLRTGKVRLTAEPIKLSPA